MNVACTAASAYTERNTHTHTHTPTQISTAVMKCVLWFMNAIMHVCIYTYMYAPKGTKNLKKCKHTHTHTHTHTTYTIIRACARAHARTHTTEPRTHGHTCCWRADSCALELPFAENLISQILCSSPGFRRLHTSSVPLRTVGTHLGTPFQFTHQRHVDTQVVCSKKALSYIYIYDIYI